MNSPSGAATHEGSDEPSATRPGGGVRENVHWSVRALLTFATVTTVVAGWFDWNSGVRAFAALAFFSLVPGCAVVRWMRPLTPTVAYALALPLSLAINCSFATASIWLHIYRPSLLVLWVGGGCLYWLWRPRVAAAKRIAPTSTATAALETAEAPGTDGL